MAERMRVTIWCFFAFLLAIPLVLSTVLHTKESPIRYNNNTFIWKGENRGDRTIAISHFKIPSGRPTEKVKRVYQTPTFAWGNTISAIKFVDIWRNGTNDNITIIEYPKNMTWAKVLFETQPGKSLEYEIQVWGQRH